jgi:CRISPR-associated endonuclease/helicase Cas3
MNAAEWLFGVSESPTRLGCEWLRFFKIPKGLFPFFHINLLASAATHDWGKANDGMQGLFHHPGSQVVRHEHLSALFLGLDSVAAWLKRRAEPSIDQDIVLAAVVSHHLKANLKTFGEPLSEMKDFRVRHDHADFIEMLRCVGDRLGLPGGLPEFPGEKFWSFRNGAGVLPLLPRREKLKDERFRPFVESLRRPENAARRRMLGAVRAALITADAAASGLARTGMDQRAWIQGAFDKARLCDAPFIQTEVIDRRVDELRQKKKWEQWSKFQDDCANREKVPARALLLAPCGSGKTLAAWRWIAARLAERPAARVIFLYPTRATAKEGFRDYVSWAPESDATLMHGTSAYDLQGMFANPDDPNDPRKENEYEVDRRLYALGNWTRRVFAATVDQFLAFLQYAYGPVCMLPVLADSILVIDEVHSFDRRMFSALKDFLKEFDLPVLCMTATLRDEPKNQLAAECGLTVYDDKPGELRCIASAPRYRLRRIDQADVQSHVRKALTENKRVLWVVNQVRRAQHRYLELARERPCALLLCYHSRFKLQDRRERHDKVVSAFKPHLPPALAITTQVCEMSLDMDADLLVTECCPITSLIQRMGRCNRAHTPRPDAGEILVYQPLDGNGRPDLIPYDEPALTGLEQFLSSLEKKTGLGQADLEEALAQAPEPPIRPDVASNFLTSGPYAMGHEESFRDIEEFTSPAVLAGNVAEFLALRNARDPVDGLLVPVPRRLGKQDDRLPSYLRVAEDNHYHPLLGFCDQPIAELGGFD